MDTNGIETTTWHDQKPSHNPKPGNLVQLEAAMEKAWLDYDGLIEQRLNWWAGNGIIENEITQDTIDKARDIAVRCQQAYYDAWYTENSDQCTCNPLSDVACDVCKAQINRKETERIIT